MSGARAVAGPRRPARRRAEGARTARARLPMRFLVSVAAGAALVAGLWGWVRDSSLVAVERVTVTGLTTRDADRIRAALESAARDMTTLHVREDHLREALAAFPVVRDIRVEREVPHRLRIEVVEHRPVLAAVHAGRRLAVAADGTVLRGVVPEPGLATVALQAAPRDGRLVGLAARDALSVARAAPPPLRRRIERFKRTRRGLTVDLRSGPDLYFGTTTRVEAKWQAAARVLADPTSAGALYVDVRSPHRPTAGGVAPPADPDGRGEEDGAATTTPGAAGTTPATPGTSPPGTTATTPPTAP